MIRSTFERRLHEWETLLREARALEADLTGLASLRRTLELAISRTASTRGLRDALQSTARDLNRRLRDSVEAGDKAAAGLRRAVERMHRHPDSL
ncbi:MAG TPA: hypothetical protein DD490_34385 [Acidobacteria bacterium]|nr:hypothetical protein [Acidobacteriota bacterium]